MDGPGEKQGGMGTRIRYRDSRTESQSSLASGLPPLANIEGSYLSHPLWSLGSSLAQHSANRISMCAPGDIWQCLETSLVATFGGMLLSLDNNVPCHMVPFKDYLA